jgi:hypothetical protein
MRDHITFELAQIVLKDEQNVASLSAVLLPELLEPSDKLPLSLNLAPRFGNMGFSNLKASEKSCPVAGRE